MTDLAEAAEVVGVPDVAAHVLAVAGPFAGRIAVSGPSPNRPFDQALAQAALATGDVGRRGARRAEPSRPAASAATPVFLARELVFLAEARRRAGAADARSCGRSSREALTRPSTSIGAGAVRRATVTRYELPS